MLTYFCIQSCEYITEDLWIVKNGDNKKEKKLNSDGLKFDGGEEELKADAMAVMEAHHYLILHVKLSFKLINVYYYYTMAFLPNCYLSKSSNDTNSHVLKLI